MTSPRGSYYTSSAFPDTPIYDSLVAERGTPQIAPIRVPTAYQPSNLPALPALPPAASHTPAQGIPAGPPSSPQPPYPNQNMTPLQSAPVPYIPQQATNVGRGGPGGGNGYPGTNGAGYQVQGQYQNGAAHDPGPRPVPPRPVPPRQAPPRPAPPYGEDQYRRPHPGQGY